MRRRRSKFGKGVFVTLLSLCLIFLIVMAGVNSMVLHRANGSIRTEGFLPNSYDGIFVLGAGLRSDGTPSDMLRDRLQCAVELYERGVAPCIILSGDRSGEDYDEVASMARYCMERGVAEGDLVRDEEGFSTYESLFRYYEGGGGRILIVTQKYHLFRALYLAQEMGIEADGCPADTHVYRGQFFRDVREVGARVKDVIKVNLKF